MKMQRKAKIANEKRKNVSLAKEEIGGGKPRRQRLMKMTKLKSV